MKLVPWSTEDKPLLLRRLQGSIHFETTLTAATAGTGGSTSGLTIPSWFVRDHAHKFEREATLRTESSAKAWPVYLFRGSEGPTKNPPPKRRRSTATSDRSQKQVENQEWRDEQTGAEGEGSDKTSDALNRRSIAVHDYTIAPIPPGGKACPHHLPRLWKTLTATNGGEGSDGTTDGLNRRSITIYECAIAPVPPSGRRACLYRFPSFWKTLTASNVCQNAGAALEFPEDFRRSYGSRIHSLVKLQGIHEQSTVRTMVCCISVSRGTRYYLRGEWRTFVTENHLHEGQQLLFTLSADSFFVVRELSAI